MVCTHLDSIREVTPSANGYEDCLKIGRLMGAAFACAVQCSSINGTRQGMIMRQVIQSWSPAISHPWGWCYIDEEMLDFTGNQTLHLHTSSVAFEDPSQR